MKALLMFIVLACATATLVGCRAEGEIDPDGRVSTGVTAAR